MKLRKHNNGFSSQNKTNWKPCNTRSKILTACTADSNLN
ncbi:hypothetical protein NC651_025932 [Populus alba x Populus x berolinensis]|nr:hypothetical protein NC651_025932 [Populus alba x Populus x berolinensis]